MKDSELTGRIARVGPLAYRESTSVLGMEKLLIIGDKIS